MPNPKDWIEEAAKEACKRLLLGAIDRATLLTILRECQPVAPSPSVPEVVSDSRAGDMQRTILELRRVNKEMKSRGIEMEVLPLAAQDLFVLLRDRAARVAEAAATRLLATELLGFADHRSSCSANYGEHVPGCECGYSDLAERAHVYLNPPAKEVEDENG